MGICNKRGDLLEVGAERRLLPGASEWLR
jgi:hypothetical protein